MKNSFALLFLLIFCMACQPAAEAPAVETPITVDTEQTKKEVRALMGQFMKAFQGVNAEAMRPLLTDGALICGTDPKELWTKEEVLAEMVAMSKVEGLNIGFNEETERIHLSEDGRSAILVQQGIVPMISTHIQVRITWQVVKVNDKWQVHFSNTSLIPPNEDLAKLSAVYEN